MDWIQSTILLCAYGFFVYIKPSEPFLTAYLMGPVHNLTEEEVVNEIYPVWIYSYLALLIPVFLLTDYLRYKPIIIFQCIGHIGCWLLLLFARGVQLMQLMQVFYAIATACEIGYYSYIYSVVDEEHYQKVTSFVRGSTLVGYFVASLLSQLLVSLANLDYYYLNVISLVNVSIAFLIALALPMPKTSLFFFAKSNEQAKNKLDNDSNTLMNPSGSVKVDTDEKLIESRPSAKATVLSLWHDTIAIYSDLTLLRWSVWWALSTCGWILVVNYIQNLWETIRPSGEHDIYNGAVESVATVLGAIGAFVVGWLKVDWSKWGEFFLALFSFMKCGLLLAMYFATSIWLCYAAYVAFILLYNVVITISQYQLALGLSTRRFALVFGVNTFAALLLNTILTIILIDKAGLQLDVNTQFVVYSGYFGVVALLFLFHAVYIVRNRSSTSIREESVEETVKSQL